MNKLKYSDPELVNLLDDYKDYIDDYVNLPNFAVVERVDGDDSLLFISTATINIPVKDFNDFIKEKGTNNYLFIYSINYLDKNKEVIVLGYAIEPFSKNITKYNSKKKRILRDIKISEILKNDI